MLYRFNMNTCSKSQNSINLPIFRAISDAFRFNAFECTLNAISETPVLV